MKINLCDSCTNIGCEFQSGIVREKCAFYMPPRIETDNCGNYVMQSKEHYNWESPITKIYGDIHNEIIRQDEENCMYTIEQAIGYKVDKEELIKALQYDRNQYEKGYNDGARETFIEEFEKIKTEIGTEFKRYGGEWENGYNNGLKVALTKVENHIAELKGENNEL